MKTIDISDIPIKYKRGRMVTLETFGTVTLAKQLTGFGERSFFICPKCEARRQKLLVEGTQIIGCRSCVSENIYRFRQNIYPKSLRYIRRRMILLAEDELNIKRLKIPFNALDYIFSKPKYMRWKRFSFVLKQLQMLEGIRFAFILGSRPSPSEINRLISHDCLDDIEPDYIRRYGYAFVPGAAEFAYKLINQPLFHICSERRNIRS